MASSSTLNDPQSKAWKGIWNAKASLRCKRVAWRACKETLPVRTLLLERGSVEDETCPCCGEGYETITHALLLCQEVRPIWFASPLGLRVEFLHCFLTLSEWFHECVEMMDEIAMGMVCTIMWALWYKRNAWVFLHKKLDCTQVIAKATSMFTPHQDMWHSWHPPSSPKIKANFHALVRLNFGTGMGIIFRDHSGTPLVSGTAFLAQCFEVEMAEAICCRWAIKQSRKRRYSKVLFETDCVQLFSEWYKREGESGVSNNEFKSLVKVCRVKSKKTRSSLTLVPHRGNEVAQSLARMAFYYGERVWIQKVPYQASIYLQYDLMAAADHAELESNC